MSKPNYGPDNPYIVAAVVLVVLFLLICEVAMSVQSCQRLVEEPVDDYRHEVQ